MWNGVAWKAGVAGPLALLGLVGVMGAACGVEPIKTPVTTRQWYLGFSGFPPKEDLGAAVAAVQMWSTRADAAIFHFEPPWKYLLAGGDMQARINSEFKGLADFYRSKGLKIFVTFDATDGLAREKESRELREAGRSIAEPAIQKIFRDFVKAWVTTIRPDYVGIGAETNLVRLAAPRSLYDALRSLCNATAADVKGILPNATLYATGQADVAWGRLQRTNTYVGVEEDFRDFPYMQALGISAYPYLAGFANPEDVPLDYLARLPNGRTLPRFIAEGGWSSASLSGVTSSPEKQARYLNRMAELLDRAQALAFLQLNFTDIDISAFPSLPSAGAENLPLFLKIGIVDSELRPKPALAVWDSLFARKRT